MLPAVECVLGICAPATAASGLREMRERKELSNLSS